MHMLLSFAAAALLAAPLPALACSPVAGYRVPTNMELAAQADLILLATVTGGTPIEAAGDPDAMRVDIRADAVLKGDPAAVPATLPVAIGTGNYAVLSDPYDLRNAHPLSLIGACIRYMVPKGSRLLFFLDRRGDQWVPAGGPFSRWAEDVLTDDAPWLAATRFYLEVQALPERERAEAMIARREALRGRSNDPVAQLLADDIERQLAGPNAPLREALPPAPAD